MYFVPSKARLARHLSHLKWTLTGWRQLSNDVVNEYGDHSIFFFVFKVIKSYLKSYQIKDRQNITAVTHIHTVCEVSLLERQAFNYTVHLNTFENVIIKKYIYLHKP